MIHVRVRLFAALRERAGARERTLALADGATAADVWPALGLGDEPPGVAVAVNRDYASRATALREGDEIALIPPVSGGAAPAAITVTDAPLDLGAVVARVSQPGAGAIASFLGTVRDRTGERDVRHLDYEVYEEMAEKELRQIAEDVSERHGLLAIAIAHRSGRCEVGEATVAIACASPHRAEAFAACREAIDTLKERAPIWKKEHYVDGASWVGQGS